MIIAEYYYDDKKISLNDVFVIERERITKTNLSEFYIDAVDDESFYLEISYESIKVKGKKDRVNLKFA